MKAYVLNAIGKLDFIEVLKPELEQGEVLVQVKAAGICGSDIPRIFENGTYHFPTIPGHEFSGVVCETGKGVSRELLGKRVGVFPLIPCMECSPCKNKQYEMCVHYDYLGSRSDGGFAEYVAVPQRNLIELPADISYEAAAMLEPASVGIHALQKVSVGEVKTAVVFGPGTIGLLIAQWLRVLGVENIFLIGTNEGQQRLAAELKFTQFYNSQREDAVKLILKETMQEGADLAIECTGYESVFADCLNAVKRGGQVILVGNPHTNLNLDKNVYWQILRKQLRLAGTWNSSFIPEVAEDDWRRTIKAITEGKLQPQKQITHRLSFAGLYRGLEIMRDKTEYYNKVMIVNE